jgi:hypothetical protein
MYDGDATVGEREKHVVVVLTASDGAVGHGAERMVGAHLSLEFREEVRLFTLCRDGTPRWRQLAGEHAASIFERASELVP